MTMKLYTWPTSPFGAKVKACIHALGMQENIEIVLYHPWQKDAELRALNPLNKIPVLVAGEDVLYDSPVICEYLNKKGKGELIPHNHRFQILKQQALCDGILDAGVSLRYETVFRPKHLRSMDWIWRQEQAIAAAMNVLSLEFSKEKTCLDLGVICAVTTLFYLDLRMPDFYERHVSRSLKEFMDHWEEHPVFLKSKPVDDTPLPENLNMLIQ